MTGGTRQDSKPIQMTVSVSNDWDAQELDAAWREIVAGRRVRVNAPARELEEIMERAMVGLKQVSDALEADDVARRNSSTVNGLNGEREV